MVLQLEYITGNLTIAVSIRQVGDSSTYVDISLQ